MKIFGFTLQELKPVYCLWLGYIHLLGLLSVVYFFFQQKQIQLYSLYGILIGHAVAAMGITAGVHRLWTRKSYDANKYVKFILMLCNSMAFQGTIFHWSRDHRLHHKYSDAEFDPHNATRGFFYAHVGWLLVKKSDRAIAEGKKLNLQDLLEDPVVQFQKKYYYTLAFMCCFLVPTLLGYFLIGGGLVYNFLLIGCYRYIQVLHATWFVNSLCHFWGTKPVNKDILPVDNFFVSLVTLGEGYHNWHHEYPKDWKASEGRWLQINRTSYLIAFLFKSGLAWVPKSVDKAEKGY